MLVSQMPPISAILQTHNDELRLGRALETLHPCDEILILDHGSVDQTLRIAREYGVRICASPMRIADAATSAQHDWLLFLKPTESITEALEATLFEWRLRPLEDVRRIPACSVAVRQESDAGWCSPHPETRLIPKTWTRWQDAMPASDPQSFLLQGDLLQFLLP